MNYHPDDMVRLDSAIYQDGGSALAQVCAPRILRYKIAGRWKRVSTTGCGYHALYEVPYERESGQLGTATVCAVDDAMGLWPRYANAVSERSFEDGMPNPNAQ